MFQSLGIAKQQKQQKQQGVKTPAEKSHLKAAQNLRGDTVSAQEGIERTVEL